MKRYFTTFALLGIAPLAHANDEPELPYLDDGNHIRLGLDMGFASSEGSSLLGLQPTLEGRFTLSDDLGLQVILPMSVVQLSGDGGETESRFDLGNPSVAVEYLFGRVGPTVKFARFGIVAPAMQLPEPSGADDLVNALLNPMNSALATLSHGHLDAWRYALESFSIFAEIRALAHVDEVYIDLNAALALSIPTFDEGDVGVFGQARGRFGYGKTFVPFVGLGLGLIPSSRSVSFVEGFDKDDGFQFSVEAGALAEFGRYKFDLSLHINIDEPGGFSFSDNGVLGLKLGGTASF